MRNWNKESLISQGFKPLEIKCPDLAPLYFVDRIGIERNIDTAYLRAFRLENGEWELFTAPEMPENSPYISRAMLP